MEFILGNTLCIPNAMFILFLDTVVFYFILRNLYPRVESALKAINLTKWDNNDFKERLEEFNYEANEEQRTSFSILNSIHFFLFIWFFCIFIINVAHRNLYLILFVTIFFLPDEIRLVRRIYLRRASRSQQNENQC